jgi:membrane carboxypeptidase/penicillin-binding protein PbpC
MYANTASFGNQTQGIEEAARYYFNALPATLDESQSLSLVATLANPSHGFPGTAYNTSEMHRITSILHLTPPAPETPAREPQPQERVSLTAFELAPLGIDCTTTCRTSLDASLTARLRGILKRNIESPSFASVNNGAIVVIATGAQENQLLAVVGSPDPHAAAGGYRINLAREPRPIGSTIKPFIYLKAFEKGARPYALVEDQEYKYTIGTGYAFYPKNYDGAYRGTVTLHEALSNSLNVPSVKVLEYVGLDAFSSFLEGTLAFQPLQPLETYGLGIALGGLEMDLMTLTNYFTLFPNEGALKPLRAVISPAGRAAPPALPPPMAAAGETPQQVAAPEIVALVNRILSDQMTRVNQFGLKSNLSLPTAHYAVKTGTSRDYHDSWAIGFTPDFVVGVWIGNHDNTPMFQVSGQSGAGKIWHETMDIMLNSEYHKKNEFSFSSLREFTESGSIEYGLPADHYDTQRYALGGAGDIMTPHQGDIFLFDPDMTLPLKARAAAQWTVNGIVAGAGEKILWKPEKPGKYRITARLQEREESVSITIERQDAALR